MLGIFLWIWLLFLTDWRWEVREKLRYSNNSNSYIQFLITEFTGVSVDENLVSTFTAILFFTTFALSILPTSGKGAGRNDGNSHVNWCVRFLRWYHAVQKSRPDFTLKSEKSFVNIFLRCFKRRSLERTNIVRQDTSVLKHKHVLDI